MSETIIAELKAGNERFVSGNLKARAKKPVDLKDGQSPHTVILTCSDSRVPPELLFDQDLGDVFIIRLAGNTATTEGIASIEYAVANLGSSVLMVLGHTSCGAVTAACAAAEGQDLPSSHLNNLVEPIKRAVAKAEGDVESAIEHNVHITKDDLLSQSAIIKDLSDSGKLQLVAAKYRLADGVVEFL